MATGVEVTAARRGINHDQITNVRRLKIKGGNGKGRPRLLVIPFYLCREEPCVRLGSWCGVLVVLWTAGGEPISTVNEAPAAHVCNDLGWQLEPAVQVKIPGQVGSYCPRQVWPRPVCAGEDDGHLLELVPVLQYRALLHVWLTVP